MSKLAKSLGGYVEPQQNGKPQQMDLEGVSAAPIQARKSRAGKSSNPDFEKIGVLVRKDTRRQAVRKWEDQDGGDLSDLIEHLMKKYLNE